MENLVLVYVMDVAQLVEVHVRLAVLQVVRVAVLIAVREIVDHHVQVYVQILLRCLQEYHRVDYISMLI